MRFSEDDNSEEDPNFECEESLQDSDSDFDIDDNFIEAESNKKCDEKKKKRAYSDKSDEKIPSKKQKTENINNTTELFEFPSDEPNIADQMVVTGIGKLLNSYFSFLKIWFHPIRPVWGGGGGDPCHFFCHNSFITQQNTPKFCDFS